MSRTDKDWTDREPGTREALNETRSIFAHARRRPLVVIALSAAITAGWCLKVAREAPAYEASMVFRIAEGDLSKSSPRLARVFKSYVSDVALNSSALLGVMRRHDITPVRLKTAPDAALADFREDINLSIWRNYLSLAGGGDGETRSARLGLSYEHKDPEVAWAVVTDLGRLIAESEETRRTSRAAFVASQLQEGGAVLRAQLDHLQHERAEKQLLLDSAAHHNSHEDTLRLGIEIKNLQAEIEKLNDRAQRFDTLAGESALRGRVEGAGIGLRFELIDSHHPQLVPRQKLEAIARVLAIGLLGIFPLVAFAVGAFDSRVYGADDVERMGLVVLGELPGFAGDDMGSLAQRLAKPLQNAARRVESDHGND